MPRFVLLFATCLLLLAASSASASAASLSLSSADAVRPQAISVDASGTADAPSTLLVFLIKDGTSCPATVPGTGVDRLTRDVPAGPFTVRLDSINNSSRVTGQYLICGYLRNVSQAALVATATPGPIRYASPACPNAEFTIVSVANDGGGTPVMTIDVPGPGSVNGTGDDGSRVSAGPQAAGRITIKAIGDGSTPGKLNSGQSVTVTYTVTFSTPFVSGGCTRTDGTDGSQGTATRAGTYTLQPTPPRGPGAGAPGSCTQPLPFSLVGVKVDAANRPILTANVPSAGDLRIENGGGATAAAAGPVSVELGLAPSFTGQPVTGTFNVRFQSQGACSETQQAITYTLQPVPLRSLALTIKTSAAGAFTAKLGCTNLRPEFDDCTKIGAYITIEIDRKAFGKNPKLGRLFDNTGPLGYFKPSITHPPVFTYYSGVKAKLRSKLVRRIDLPLVVFNGLYQAGGPGLTQVGVQYLPRPPHSKQFVKATLTRGQLRHAVVLKNSEVYGQNGS